MEKLNKVIAGLECCLDEDRSCRDNCPYFKGYYMLDGCMDDLLAEALEVLRSGSGDLISRAALMKFPIRIDHYDKVNGNEHFVYGVETVLEYAECLPRVEAEPVVHAHWEDEYGGKYANPRYRCSVCKGKALYKFERNLLDQWQEVQALTDRCPNCGAHMDEEVADG